MHAARTALASGVTERSQPNLAAEVPICADTSAARIWFRPLAPPRSQTGSDRDTSPSWVYAVNLRARQKITLIASSTVLPVR